MLTKPGRSEKAFTANRSESCSEYPPLFLNDDGIYSNRVMPSYAWYNELFIGIMVSRKPDFYSLKFNTMIPLSHFYVPPLFYRTELLLSSVLMPRMERVFIPPISLARKVFDFNTCITHNDFNAQVPARG